MSTLYTWQSSASSLQFFRVADFHAKRKSHLLRPSSQAMRPAPRLRAVLRDHENKHKAIDVVGRSAIGGELLEQHTYIWRTSICACADSSPSKLLRLILDQFETLF